MVVLRRDDIREYEAANFIAELVGEARFILNIGPSWGRDFYTLSERGKQVINMDIAPQPHLPHMVIADANQMFPFPACLFDAVVMAEVLEHLVQDWMALKEVRRVLKDDGRLIVTVPFYNDKPPYHVRIYSPRTILRLLAASGFGQAECIYRGGMVRFPRLVHMIRKIFPPKLERTWYQAVVAIDWRLGRQSWFQHMAEGAYIVATKTKAIDYRHLNIGEFQF